MLTPDSVRAGSWTRVAALSKMPEGIDVQIDARDRAGPPPVGIDPAVVR